MHGTSHFALAGRPQDPSGSAPEPDGFVTITEEPGVYAQLLGPLYASLPLPKFLALDLTGRSQFFNRAARAGYVLLVEAEGGEGACLGLSGSGRGTHFLSLSHSQLGRNYIICLGRPATCKVIRYVWSDWGYT